MGAASDDVHDAHRTTGELVLSIRADTAWTNTGAETTRAGRFWLT